MPFNLVGGPEEASQQLIAHLTEKGILPKLGLHQNAHKELIDNGDGTYNCRKCSDDSCPYNKLGDALSDLSASVSLAQRLDEVEKKLFESLQLIRQIRLEEERRKVDR